METKQHNFIAVDYQLSASDDVQEWIEIEKTSKEKPFQWISDMGVVLPKFEEEMAALEEGSEFDFFLSEEDAYGHYDKEHVIELDKSIFSVSGHFDSEHVYQGAVLPLMNEAGQRFEGLVMEVGDKKVTVDVNHPLAGRKLHFQGVVLTKRPAKNEEIEAMAKMLSGEGGCSCGCEGGDCDHEGEGHHCHNEEEGGCGCHCH